MHGFITMTGIHLQVLHLPGKSITNWPDVRLMTMWIQKENGRYMSLRKQINTDKAAFSCCNNYGWKWKMGTGSRGMDRIFGHQQGVNAVREIIEAAAELEN